MVDPDYIEANKPAVSSTNDSLIIQTTQEVVEGKQKEFYWIDPTFLNSVESCGQLTYFNHILNLRLAIPDETLDRGSFVHDILQLHYLLKKEGKLKYNDIIDACVGYAIDNRHSFGIPPEVADGVIDNYKDYANYYYLDGWQPIEVESTFAKPMYEDDEIVIVGCGIIDLVTDTKAGPILVDHKSYDRWRNPIKLSNQLITYAWATEIRTAYYNKIGFQKTYGPEKRFRRVPFLYTKNNIEVWLRNAIYWAKEGIKYEKTGFWPRNYTSCDKFRGCRFVDLCAGDEDVIEYKIKAQFKVGEKWDPHKRDKNKKMPLVHTEEDAGIEE